MLRFGAGRAEERRGFRGRSATRSHHGTRPTWHDCAANEVLAELRRGSRVRMPRLPMVLSAAVLAGFAAPAAGRKVKTSPETLLRVSTPVSRRTVPAHPFVNVIVDFDTGNGADPQTFRARLGSVNVTSRFEPIVENGAVVGRRAALGPALLHVGRRYNRLRFTVRGRGPDGARLHDVDRVRFRTVEARTEPPSRTRSPRATSSSPASHSSSTGRRVRIRSPTSSRTSRTSATAPPSLCLHRDGRRIGDFRKLWKKRARRSGSPAASSTTSGAPASSLSSRRPVMTRTR